MPLGAANGLLTSLSDPVCRAIVAHGTSCDLPLRTALYEAEVRPRYAYFITSGLASVMTMMENGETVEVGLIGHEGLVGGLHLMGPGRISTRCFMQIDGSGPAHRAYGS